jgi:hypothetical protein
MPRPRRLYKEDTGKYYYMINGKRKYVKVPEGISSTNLSKINIKNIINLASAKRRKPGAKRQPKFQKKIISGLEKTEQGGLSLYVFQPQRKIKTLEDLAKESDDTSVDKLSRLLLKGVEVKPSSSKVQPTIATMREQQALPPAEDKRKPGKPPGKEPVIRETSLIKVITNWFEKHEEYPSLDEVNNSIKSQYTDVTREQYNSALDKAGEIIDQYVANPKEQTTFEKFFKGKGYDGDGLYNDEIEEIAKKRIKDYVPVIASDQLDELPKYVARGDKRFGFVINTNPSTSDGSGNDGMRPGHWRAVFINNEDDYPSIEYFDPLAEGKMPEDLIKMCRRIAVKMNPEVMFKYKQNMLRRQSKLTSNCGWHCVKFLDDRYNGIPYSESSGYDAYMEGLNNTPDASRDGEKEIASYIKKYESYI